MIIGQTIVAVAEQEGTASTTVYTPWIATWGNSALFAYEIIAIGGPGATLSVEVYTKTTEAADPGTQVGSTSSQTTAGTYTISASSLLELVRMKFTLSVTNTGSCCTAFAHFRPLNPSWNTN